MERYTATKNVLQRDKQFQVFLSFRGKDVRKTLVDHLYQALSVAGLNAFLDTEKLKRGEKIGEALEKAIESSAIRIPIFSKEYAGSAWCLKEAAAMLKSPGMIIPLFYHVDPTDARYPEKVSSPYHESFLKHYGLERYPTTEIDDWKKALQEICSRSGWSTDMTQGFEAQLVKLVVNDLIETLDMLPLNVAKHLVGIDSMKNSILQKLNLNSVDEVVKVGIWGMGGIGKTTLAKVVYNHVYSNFEAASFVFDVRDTAAKKGLSKLQKKILKDLIKYDGEVDAVAKGLSLFESRLGGKRVLLVLDDVHAVDQLNALVGDWLGPGSRVIITSRDEDILNHAGVLSERMEKMTGLETNAALELFSWHAFLRASPSLKYYDLSKRIVEACKGRPLSLELIGSRLYDKDDTGCWTEALQKFAHIEDIYNDLYISYNDLPGDEKEIFVDIACFFVGEDKTLPIVFWKSLDKMVDTALLNLSNKLLIRIDDGVFHMHDLLQDMGRTIAEKEKEGTVRRWEAHLSTLSDNKSISRLRLSEGNPQRLEMLCRPGLRYLHLQNLAITGIREDILATLPESVIWLRLEHCSFAIGTNRAAKKSRHSRSGDNYRQSKIIQLKGCSDLDSYSISSLFSLSNIQLQHFDLRWSKSLVSLPESIGNLSQLQHLNLGWCNMLNNLPDTIGNLSQLQHLNMLECSSLNNLPGTIGKLSQLQQLNLERCISLKNLPDTIGNLSQLQQLNLESCVSLNDLPDSIVRLPQLQQLDLRWCNRLNKLPDTIGNLSQLQELYLGRCSSLNELPDSICNLSRLQKLDLEWCGSLQNLPTNIGNLSNLKHLDLSWCRSLQNLPDTMGNLSQLHLKLRGCERLKQFPRTFYVLRQLKYSF